MVSRTDGQNQLLDIQAALDLFGEPGQLREIRGILKKGGAVSFFTTDTLEAATWAARREGQPDLWKGLFFCLNQFVRGAGAATSDGDVTRRLWVPVDVDPTKSEPNGSATDVEKAAAKAVADRVVAGLQKYGFKEIVTSDSGNGYHASIPVSMSNDATSTAAIKALFQRLESRFGNPAAHIDQTIFNASRVLKLPGSTARKGAHSAIRPHRMAAIIDRPETVTDAARQHNSALLLQILKEEGKPKAQPAASGVTMFDIGSTSYTNAGTASAAAGMGEVDDILTRRRRCEKYINAMPIAVAGSGGSARHYAVAMACVEGFGLPMPDAISAMEGWNGRCLPPWSDKEIKHTVGSAMKDAGQANAIGYLFRDERPSPTATTTHSTTSTTMCAVTASPSIWLPDAVGFDQVVETELSWLWQDLIPFGCLTSLEGPPKVGKSTIMVDVISRLSRGDAMPFQTDKGDGFPCGVSAILSPEDPVSSVVLPRLRAANADLSKVKHYRGTRQEIGDASRPFTLSPDQLKSLEEYIVSNKVRLLYIDAIMSALPEKADSNSDNGMRSLLLPLAAMADRQAVAIVIGRHFTKGAGMRAGIERGIGSTAFAGVVRSLLQCGKNPDDPTMRVVGVCGSNSGAPADPMSFKLQSVQLKTNRGHIKPSVKIEWGQLLPDFDLDSLARTAVPKAERVGDIALEWLESRLKGLEHVDVGLVDAEAKAQGVSRTALATAKKTLTDAGLITTKKVEKKFKIFPAGWLGEDDSSGAFDS